MKKDVLRIVVSLAVLVGLVLFVSWHRKRKFEKEERTEEEKKLVSVDFDTIGRIVLTDKETGPLVLERREKDPQGKFSDEWAPLSYEFDSLSEWKITGPVKALPDYYSVNTLITNIKEISSTKTIAEKGENPETYNLAAPPIQIDLIEKNQTAPKLTIKVGDQNSAKSGLYIQTSASPQIVLASNTLDYLKTRKLDEWRKKEIIGFRDLSKVKRMEVTYDDKGKQTTITAVRGDEGWALQKPKSLPADAKVIESLLSDLKSLRANSIPSGDGAKDAKIYGFEKPYARFSVDFDADGTEQKRTVLIGNKFDKEKDIYVRRMDYPEVYAVRFGMKETLTKELKDFILKKPFAADQGNVTGLAVSKDGKTTELAKKDGKWSLTKPAEDRANGDQVTSLLGKLVDLEAAEFLGSDKPASFGKPQTVVTLLLGEKKREGFIFDPGSGKDPIVNVGDPQRFYRVARAKFEEAMKALEGVREKKLMPVFAEGLSSIQIQRDGIKVSFIRNAEEQWVLGTVEGGEPSLKAKLREKSAAETLIRTLEGLEIDTFMDGGAGSPEAGAMSIEFRPKEGDSMSWSFAKKEGDKMVVRSPQRNVSGQMAASKLAAIDDLFQSAPAKKE